MTAAAVQLSGAVPPPPAVDWPGPVTFEVQEGGFVLVATFQATATRLIRLVAGLRAPASGRVVVLGTEPGLLSRREACRFRRRLGVAFHDPAGLVSNLDLEMNLVVPQVYAGLRGMRPARQAAGELMERLELTEWSRVRPADLPPEIRKETAVARALVRRPELLVLEDPTGGLDDARAERLLGLCREHARTILVTVSDPNDTVERAADRTILIQVDEHGMGVV